MNNKNKIKINCINGEKISKNLESFLRHLDAILETLGMSLLLIEPYSKKSINEFIKFLNKNQKNVEEDENTLKVSVRAEDSKMFEQLEKNASISSIALDIIPDSLFVSLISQYDMFLGTLLRCIFEIKPEILNSSNKSIVFSEIVKKSSIEDIKNDIIESEVENFLRKSHADQFDYLEEKIGISLRKNLPIWQTFIEITERRNLLVHCGGVVSGSYIKNCNDNKCNIQSLKIGDKLDIEFEYFQEASRCLYEISIKLTHTVWRKLLTDDLELADKELNNICYKLIDRGSFLLADTLLNFSINQKKIFDETYKNLYTINASLSKYLQDDKVEAKKIINMKDWSASSDEFKLAHAILNDKNDLVYKIMKKIGNVGAVKSIDYREWPLFSLIRKEDEFKKVYKEIFNEDYKITETPMRPVQKILEKERKKTKNKKLLHKTNIV